MVRYQVESRLKGEALAGLEGDYDSYTRAARKIAREIVYHGTFKTKFVGTKKGECMVEETSRCPYRHKCTGSKPAELSELYITHKFQSPEAAMNFLARLESEVIRARDIPHEGIEHLVRRADDKKTFELTGEERDRMERYLRYLDTSPTEISTSELFRSYTSRRG